MCVGARARARVCGVCVCARACVCVCVRACVYVCMYVCYASDMNSIILFASSC